MFLPVQLRLIAWSLGHWSVALWIALVVVNFAHAEVLPLKTYSAADGLPQNHVNRIVFDSRGFIWFCTIEGLSRFDGYKFTNYGIEQGLPHRNVNDLLETPSGDYWLATSSGLVRFNPAGIAKPLGAGAKDGASLMFSIVPIETSGKSDYLFTSLIQDQAGQLWCGTEMGLLRLLKKEQAFTLRPTRLWDTDHQKYGVESLLADHQNTIWVGTASQIFRLLPDGKPEQFTPQEGLPNINVMKLYEDRAGRIWAGTGEGLFELNAAPQTGASMVKQAISTPQGLPGKWVRDIWQAADGTYWVATDRGLCKFSLAANGQYERLVTYTKANGLSDYYIKRVVGDQYGNLWIGSANAGAMKLVIDGFTSYGHEAGMPAVNSIFTNKAGELFLTGYVPVTARTTAGQQAGKSQSSTALTWQMSWMNQDRFTWLRPNVPPAVQFSYGWNQISFQDSQGEWWFATQSGLFRFPRTARFADLLRIKPKAVYNTQNGLSNNNVTRLFEDAKGDIWIANSSDERNSLDRWERATERLHNLSSMKGMEALNNRPVSAFGEDRSGNLWIGLSSNIATGGVVRYRDGAITFYTNNDELPTGNVYFIHTDATGKLWIASTIDGVICIDDPNAEQPKFIRYSTANGLSSNRVTSISEDIYGRMYFGTGKGVDQLAQKTGKIRHFSHADGLPLGSVDDSLRDGNGNERGTGAASATEPMEKVAATSRAALDAMSDLVWAINPERDQLSDLSQRMRRFASDTLSAHDITLRFHAPPQEISLDAEVRRQVFLIFKECITNIARHAEATAVEVEFAMPDHHLSLRVQDNGRGLRKTTPRPGQNGGNGLLSMRRCATELGGTLEVVSNKGTLVKLKAPLHLRRKR